MRSFLVRKEHEYEQLQRDCRTAEHNWTKTRPTIDLDTTPRPRVLPISGRFGTNGTPLKLGYVCTNSNNSHHTVGGRPLAGTQRGRRARTARRSSTTVRGRTAVATLRELATATPSSICFSNRRERWCFKGPQRGIQRCARPSRTCQHLVTETTTCCFRRGSATRCSSNRVARQHPVVSPDILTLDGGYQNPHVIHTISRKRELVHDLYYASYALALAIRWAARITGHSAIAAMNSSMAWPSRSTRATGRAT